MEKTGPIRIRVDYNLVIADFRLRLANSAWNQQRLSWYRRRYKLIEFFSLFLVAIDVTI